MSLILLATLLAVGSGDVSAVLYTVAYVITAVTLWVALVYLWRKWGPKRPAVESMRILCVLGSGGHTYEAICALKAIVQESRRTVSSIRYVVADTDATSEARVCSESLLLKLLEKHAEALNLDTKRMFVRIPRAREVRQSYITSVFTTMRSIVASFAVVWRESPDMILVNGPGTCIPVCFSSLMFRLLGMNTTKVVFIESFCRVKSLSLTGKLLYPVVDMFVVQWKELQQRYPSSVYFGHLCLPSPSSETDAETS